MKFLTFQPKDYENMKRYADWKERYYNVLGFNPIYCICAETLLSTVIGAAFAYPLIPEQAIFFKCKDYYVIDKTLHINKLTHNDVKSYVFPRLYFRKMIKRDYDYAFTDINFFGEDVAAGRYEFLINPSDMQIIEIVDIKECLLNTDIDKDSINQIKNLIIEDAHDDYLRDLKNNNVAWWDTEDMYIRRAVSTMWWEWYALENDCLIEDYKRIIGCKDYDWDISMVRCPIHHLHHLRDNYNCNPCDMTFNKFRDCLMTTVVKNKD